jgi:hypothetical protein
VVDVVVGVATGDVVAVGAESLGGVSAGTVGVGDAVVGAVEVVVVVARRSAERSRSPTNRYTR